jgi:hypothetical protein
VPSRSLWVLLVVRRTSLIIPPVRRNLSGPISSSDRNSFGSREMPTYHPLHPYVSSSACPIHPIHSIVSLDLCYPSYSLPSATLMTAPHVRVLSNRLSPYVLLLAALLMVVPVQAPLLTGPSTSPRCSPPWRKLGNVAAHQIRTTVSFTSHIP